MILKSRKHIDKPWGCEEQLALNEMCTVKILTVNSGEELSYQTHTDREEHWLVLSDSAVVVIGSKERVAKKGEEIEILRGIKHQLKGGDAGSKVLEICKGVWRNEDIVRLKDKYKRS